MTNEAGSWHVYPPAPHAAAHAGDSNADTGFIRAPSARIVHACADNISAEVGGAHPPMPLLLPDDAPLDEVPPELEPLLEPLELPDDEPPSSPGGLPVTAPPHPVPAPDPAPAARIAAICASFDENRIGIPPQLTAVGPDAKRSAAPRASRTAISATASRIAFSTR